MSAEERTAVVTGATGFIGRAVVPTLLAQGWTVHAWLRSGSTRELPNHVQVISQALPPDPEADLRPLVPAGGVDLVVNLAAAGAQQGGAASGEALRDVNERLPERVLRAVGAASRPRFLHIASCFELADGTPGALMGDDHPVEPFSPYGATKAAGAEAVQRLGERLSVPVIVLRLFGCYGPGEAPTRLLPYLVTALQNGEPAELTAGTQTRDFTWVTDVAAAIACAATAPDLKPGTPYNVCSGVPTTVRQLAELAAAVCGRPDLLQFGARTARADEPVWMVGDASRFRAATGWSPEVPLAEGIARLCRATAP
ncbi:MAG: NAD-dependent epimerase/dehydratase family protein [Planctomycetota bacterium]|jgi:nucleoside-diphosphate-sugar epimerase